MSVSEGELNDDEYYGKFRGAGLSTLDAFRLFFAKLALRDISFVKSDKLKEFVFHAKRDGLHDELLKNISVRFNGFFYVSEDIEKNINSLQIWAPLGRSNPSYDTVINHYSKSSAEKTDKELESYSSSMENLIDSFIEYSQRDST